MTYVNTFPVGLYYDALTAYIIELIAVIQNKYIIAVIIPTIISEVGIWVKNLLAIFSIYIVGPS